LAKTIPPGASAALPSRPEEEVGEVRVIDGRARRGAGEDQDLVGLGVVVDIHLNQGVLARPSKVSVVSPALWLNASTVAKAWLPSLLMLASIARRSTVSSLVRPKIVSGSVLRESSVLLTT
jgi:hypothetical protein